MITVLFGDEPYLIQRHMKSLTSDGDFFRHQKFSSDTIRLLWTESFFGLPKGIVELDSLKQLNEEFFVYAKEPNENATLIVQLGEVDTKNALYKQLSSLKTVDIVRYDKVSADKLTQFVLSIIKRNGKLIRKDALECILDRADYGADGHTLFTVGNMVQALCAAGEEEEITKKLIDALYPEVRAVNKFHVAELIEKGDKKAMLETADILTETEGVVAFLSILYREFRIAYKAKFFSASEIGVWRVNFKSWSEEELLLAMEIVGSSIEKQKSNLLPEEICIAVTMQKLIEMKEGAA